MSNPAIVVPLDASEHALVALPVAKRLAELGSATLHFVHVARESAPASDVLEKIGLTASQLRGSVLDTKSGEPAAGIIRAARELQAVLIVMCTHTGDPALDKALGGTALAVLKGAPCPVVLVRPERGMVPWALHRVLVPHDGTPTASAAIRLAAELAGVAGAEIAVLHVAAPGCGPPAELGSLMPPRYMDQPQHEWPTWVGEFLERLGSGCQLGSLKVRMFLAHGVPREEVLRFAADHPSDLVVLGWREGGKESAPPS
jgi:nucleotide-binding universal stress UspA family protein